MVLYEKLKITKVITIHPKENRNFCTKFHDNPCNTMLKTINVNLTVALEEKLDRGSAATKAKEIPSC